jgi:hypothetical protein
LFSPALFLIVLLLRLGLVVLLVGALAACWVDLAVVNQVRATSEPLPTLDDLAYDNTFTSM